MSKNVVFPAVGVLGALAVAYFFWLVIADSPRAPKPTETPPTIWTNYKPPAPSVPADPTSKPADPKPAPPVPVDPPKKPSAPKWSKMDIEEFAKLYNENELSIENTYPADSRYQVRGLITGIRKNPFGGSIVTLSSQNQKRKNRSIECYFSEESNSDVANMKKGTVITIEGKYKGLTLGAGEMDDCGPPSD